MIELTDLHGNEFVINAELIEKVENNPDTQVMLSNGHRYYVKNTLAEIAERVIGYRGACLGSAEMWLSRHKGE